MSKPVLDIQQEEIIQLPGIFKRYRASVGIALRDSLHQDHIMVYDMLRYCMGWVDTKGNSFAATEGKALRATLCLFGCEVMGGSTSKAMPAAVALELIHNFSLIHDDIQDRDETRHHRPTVWAVWGVPKALVAGNVLRVIADKSIQGLLREGINVEQVLSVVNMLTEAYLEMIEGQHLDISYEGRPDISMDNYMNMISKKTGALIRCSLNLGVSIGTSDLPTIQAFRAFGNALGYVFQIRDDVLGVWGEEDSTGKPVGSDIRRKKNSLPVVYAMSMAKSEEKKRLKSIYQKQKLTDCDLKTVLAIMDSVDTREYAQQLALQYAELALESLAGVNLQIEKQRDIQQLVNFLLVRQY